MRKRIKMGYLNFELPCELHGQEASQRPFVGVVPNLHLLSPVRRKRQQMDGVRREFVLNAAPFFRRVSRDKLSQHSNVLF